MLSMANSIRAKKANFDGGIELEFNDALKTKVRIYNKDEHLTFVTAYGNVPVSAEVIRKALREYDTFKLGATSASK